MEKKGPQNASLEVDYLCIRFLFFSAMCFRYSICMTFRTCMVI